MYDQTGADRREDDRMVADFFARTGAGLEGVYAAYGKLLYSVARSVLGDDEDAQDCVHDALLRIWQGAGSYRPERGSLRAYLAVSVRNEALTRKRNAARHFRIEQRAATASELGAQTEPEVNDPIERARVRRALAALPAEQKIALELAYFGQLTHVEIAARLDVPLGTIKSRIALGLRKLGGALGHSGRGAS